MGILTKLLANIAIKKATPEQLDKFNKSIDKLKKSQSDIKSIFSDLDNTKIKELHNISIGDFLQDIDVDLLNKAIKKNKEE